MNAKRKIAAAGAMQSQELADTVTESFLERLKSVAKNKGGALIIKNAKALNAEFNHEKEALKAIIDRSFEDYVKTHEQAVLNLSREHPFNRLIVSKFAHLFKEDHEIIGEDDDFSRRILPGFFWAMNMMLGQDVFEKLEERTELIVKRLSEGRELEFSWEEVYNDGEGKDLILDALVAMAIHFEDFDRRAEWFINLVNDRLNPVTEDENPELRTWAFTEEGFKELLRALFSGLIKDLPSKSGKEKILKKYGSDAYIDLTKILKQFN